MYFFPEKFGKPNPAKIGLLGPEIWLRTSFHFSCFLLASETLPNISHKVVRGYWQVHVFKKKIVDPQRPISDLLPLSEES